MLRKPGCLKYCFATPTSLSQHQGTPLQVSITTACLPLLALAAVPKRAQPGWELEPGWVGPGMVSMRPSRQKPLLESA